MGQTYQELTKEVIKELPLLSNYEPQEFFWILKQNEPERFERMWFDTNSWQPYSDTLSVLMVDLMICGKYIRPYKYIKLDENLIRRLKIEQLINRK